MNKQSKTQKAKLLPLEEAKELERKLINKLKRERMKDFKALIRALRSSN